MQPLINQSRKSGDVWSVPEVEGFAALSDDTANYPPNKSFIANIVAPIAGTFTVSVAPGFAA